MKSDLGSMTQDIAADIQYDYELNDSANHQNNSNQLLNPTEFINKIRAEQQSGPPPNITKRQLIFDSLQKIISRNFGKLSSRQAVLGETRGTYVFTWGAGYHGQLGRNFERGKKKYTTVPKIIYLNVAIRQISCGGLHTAAVTDAGTVYTWGDARAYQLGYAPHGFTNQPTPALVESLESHVFITQVACGQTHTVALTDKGNIITWGSSKYGQCGHNDRQIVKNPKKVRIDDPSLKFIDISCGDKHTVALSNTGRVWAFGCCQQGQLGLNETPAVDKLKPTPVTIEENGVAVNIVSVVCGSIHTCCVSDTGELWLFGFGEHFIPDENNNFFYKPVKVQFNERIIQVACGQAHILALTANGDVYAWGSGSYGQLGHGVKGDLNQPRLVLVNKNIASIAAGRYHSLALTNAGALYSWGCGENGQLGHHNDENILFPRVIEPNLGTVVGQISCGEHHTAVLTSTPWSKVDGEIGEWLHGENEEYATKITYLRRTNHGLMRKDLQLIEQRMLQLKQQWANDKQQQLQDERDGYRKDIESIETRDSIQADVLNHTLNTYNNHTNNPTDEKQAHDDTHERPDSSSEPLHYNKNKRNTDNQSNIKKSNKLPSVYTRPGSTDSLQPFKTTTTVYQSVGQPSRQSLQSQQSVVSVDGGASEPRAQFLKDSAALVNKMKSIIQKTSESSNVSRLNSTTAQVLSFRKDYDQLKNLSRIKSAELQQIQHSVESYKYQLDHTRNKDKLCDFILNSLHMKLSTVTIKITETEENKKNYALNIAHLKDEELERYYQLEGLRRQQSENDNFCRKLNEIKLHALEEKDKSEQELQLFKHEINQYIQFIQSQIQQFKHVSAIALQRRKKREQEKIDHDMKLNEKIENKINKLYSDINVKYSESQHMVSQLNSVNERLRYFEKRFSQIVSVTGLTDPNEIINKFQLKNTIQNELQHEISNKKTQIQLQQHILDELTNECNVLKNNFIEYKWCDIDTTQDQLYSVQSKYDKSTVQYHSIQQRLALVKESIVTLISILPIELFKSDTMTAEQNAQQLIQQITQQSTDHTIDIVQLFHDKLIELNRIVQAGEVLRLEHERVAAEKKHEKELALQQRVAADLAEKMKILTRRNNNLGINRNNIQYSKDEETSKHHNDNSADNNNNENVDDSNVQRHDDITNEELNKSQINVNDNSVSQDNDDAVAVQ